MVKTRMASREIERFRLEQLVILSHRLGISDDKETQQLNALRKLRNDLIHGNAGKLAKMAKMRYEDLGGINFFSSAEFYIAPIMQGVRSRCPTLSEAS